MKTKIATLTALLLSAVALLHAAPLAEPTAVHAQPADAAQVLAFLPAGSEPTPTADSLATSPAGWMAVELPGPIEGHVQNRDILKSLDVREGAAIRNAPDGNAPVVLTAMAGLKTEITGLRGKWTQVRVVQPVVGYVRLAAQSAAPAPARAPAAPVSAPTPVPAGIATGSAAPMVNLGDGGSSTLPRLLQGRFMSTRRPFAPRRPYDWQLVDDAGVRYAYLDVSKLLLTEQIESYAGRTVVVFGSAKTAPGVSDIVITVESLQLK